MLEVEKYKKFGKQIRKMRKDGQSVFQIAEKLGVNTDRVKEIECGDLASGIYKSIQDHVDAGMTPGEALHAFAKQMEMRK